MIVPRYGPGAWLAVVTDGHVCLLHPDVDLDTVTALWTAVREGAGLTAQLQLLLAGGLDALPPFALVALERDRVHVVVRGEVEVEVDAEEPRTVRGRRVATWQEDVVEGAYGVVARVLDSAAGSDARLPVLSAVVHADVVAVDLRSRRSARATGAASEPVAQPASAEHTAGAGATASTAPAAGDTAAPVAATPQPVDDGLDDLEQTVLNASTDTSVGLRLDLDAAPAAPPVRRPVLAQPQAPAPAPPWPRVEPVRATPAPPVAEPSAEVAPPVVPQPSLEQDGPGTRPQPEAPPAPAARPAPAQETSSEGTAPALVPSAPGAPEDVDHDGTTVLSSDVVALRRQLPEWAGDGVPGPLAVPAPDRPAPAKIRLSSGLVVSLNRPVLLGRAPQVSRVSNREMPRLITVASPRQDISRTHAEVRMDGEDVLVTDLRSTNGVLLLRQGHGPQRLHPGEPTVVEPGVSVDLGEGVTFVVERGA
jgi:resuscitation-promoting factor RpfA